ncbi:MAG: cohesin domain-containing protein, partial [Bacteroidota bacterium]
MVSSRKSNFVSSQAREDRCFAVKANNFNGIGSVQFSLAWDETKLDFLELTNFALEGLSTTNFNTNLTDDGLLAFSWLATDLVNGETLADGGTLFEVCLAANAEEEATTLIDFANFPTPVEITDVTPEVLNFTTEAATVILNGGTNGSDETELSLDDATVMIGEQFCLPVRVAAFTDVIGMQASISWDPQALQFTGVQAFNLPSLTNASFNEFAEAQLEGILRVLWNSPDLLGVSRSDNEALFELCFIATGDAGDYPVDFVDQPLPLQLVTEDFTEIATATSGGLVTIGSQTTDDVRLRIGSTAVAPGELTCVPVEAQAFNDIVAMQFSLNWDDDRIRFDELILVDNELGLEESDFNILSFDGTLSLAWIADNILEPITLAEGTTLFELCYTAQSQEGQAGIIFSTQPTAIEFVRENTLVPFVPTNGTIMVTSDNLVWPGDTNEDGIANNLDVLPLGLGFESTGPSRINPSTSWLPQFAAPWPAATPESSINFRHAD